MSPSKTLACLLTLSVLVSCTPKQEPPPAVGGDADAGTWTSPLESLPVGLDKFDAMVPDDNAITEPKVELGRHLYFDTRLSADDTVSCASCHDPAKGWSDGSSTSTGIGGQVGGRNSPTVINRLFSGAQFWDGRAASLEEQALGPVANPIEMGNTLEAMVTTLNGIAGYKPLFNAAFGSEEITQERVGQAIATFERTIVSGNSPYDRFQAGDKSALSESAARGREIFFDNNKGRCSICHAGNNFTDEKYHNIGIGMEDAEWEKNHTGRFAVTNDEKDKGAFKTPTLRQLTESGPYMHDGSDKTLEEVVEFYVKGGVPGHANLDPEMKPLELTDQDKKDLVEFMKALTGDVTPATAPERVN